MFNYMIKVGLSGNRYSGTEDICNIFKKLTIPVFEADVILKFIINHKINVSHDIKSKLKNIHNDLGQIEPKLVRSRKEAEIILECAQIDLMECYNRFSEKNKSSIYTIFHSSVLFEKSWHKLMDYNIVIFCPKITRMERCRAITKNKISDIAYLMSSEIDDLDKNRMANFVVHNYESRNPLDQIHKIDQFVIDSYLRQDQSIVSKHF